MKTFLKTNLILTFLVISGCLLLSRTNAQELLCKEDERLICNNTSPLITSEFGERFGDLHTGTDYGLDCGENVLASADGVVIEIYTQGVVLGNQSTPDTPANYIKLEHTATNGTKYQTWYWHLQNVYVKKGQKVESGNIIGAVGNTGYVRGNPEDPIEMQGCHLHFEIRKENQIGDFYTVDPQLYLEYSDPSSTTNISLAENLNLNSNIGQSSELACLASPYKLPWPGGINKYVTQDPQNNSVNSSHLPYDTYNQNAIDFGVGFNEDIVAVDSGEVLFVEDQFVDGDPNDIYKISDGYQGGCYKTYSSTVNRIAIKHSMTEGSIYLHLKKDSILVRKGDIVIKGQILGKVGFTGWNCGVHLHHTLISMSTYESAGYGASIPISYSDQSACNEVYKGHPTYFKPGTQTQESFLSDNYTNVIQLKTPENGKSIIEDSTVNFTWDPLDINGDGTPETTQYDFWLYDADKIRPAEGQGRYLYQQVPQPNTSINTSILPKGKDFIWEVTAQYKDLTDTDKDGDTSETLWTDRAYRIISTKPAAPVQLYPTTTNPGTPILIPRTLSGGVDFKWEGKKGYQYEISIKTNGKEIFADPNYPNSAPLAEAKTLQISLPYSKLQNATSVTWTVKAKVYDSLVKNYIVGIPAETTASLYQTQEIPTFPAKTTGAKPVYRIRGDLRQTYLYTISADEKSSLLDNFAAIEFKYEQIGFYAYEVNAAGECNSDQIAVHRFINSNGQYFFSTNKEEGMNLPFTYENIGYCAFANPSEGRVEVYRLRNGKTYLLTTNVTEKNTLINLGWQNEGVAFYAETDREPSGLVAVSRFIIPELSSHFYTASAAERDIIISTRPSWKFEKIAFFAYSTDSTGTCQTGVPVYRYFNNKLSSYFYTLSQSEPIAADVSYEGIGFCAYESNLVEGLLPVYRFFYPNASLHLSSHFYVVDTPATNDEKDNLTGWTDEGIRFFAYLNAADYKQPINPDITASISANPSVVESGKNVVLGVNLKNTSPINATNLQFEINLPNELTYVSNSNGNLTCNYAVGKLTCTTPNIGSYSAITTNLTFVTTSSTQITTTILAPQKSLSPKFC